MDMFKLDRYDVSKESDDGFKITIKTLILTFSQWTISPFSGTKQPLNNNN